MQHSFDDPEHWAKRFDAEDRAAWQKPTEVVAAMQIEPGMTVADIGAGTGYFLAHLSPAAGPSGKVWALDIEPKLVAYMQARVQKEGWDNVEVKVIPGDDPQLVDADRVLIVDTWHHIPGRVAYAKRIFAGLKPGGSLYIVDFTEDGPMGPPAKYRIKAATIIATLKAAGFAAELVQESLPHQFIVRATRPLQD